MSIHLHKYNFINSFMPPGMLLFDVLPPLIYDVKKRLKIVPDTEISVMSKDTWWTSRWNTG